MHDNDAVPCKAHVELEPVSARLQSPIEGFQCVFRRETRAAAVGEDERGGRIEEGMAHAATV